MKLQMKLKLAPMTLKHRPPHKLQNLKPEHLQHLYLEISFSRKTWSISGLFVCRMLQVTRIGNIVVMP